MSITLSVKKAVSYPVWDAKTRQVMDIPTDRFVEWPYSQSLMAAIQSGELIREVRAPEVIEIHTEAPTPIEASTNRFDSKRQDKRPRNPSNSNANEG